MTSNSPLLWLQEQNTDLWEMLMIELVKCRYNNNIIHLKKQFLNYYNKHVYKSEFYQYSIHPGRTFLNLMNQCLIYDRPLLINELHLTKYYVFGWKLSENHCFYQGIGLRFPYHHSFERPFPKYIYKDTYWPKNISSIDAIIEVCSINNFDDYGDCNANEFFKYLNK